MLIHSPHCHHGRFMEAHLQQTRWGNQVKSQEVSLWQASKHKLLL
jgi:hypothetical protein